ncbi:hypothetical protein GN244_ATG13237 [Phytophthora infestans]|uniref:PX domain-containing protein n=1 Tax=Phytophthora infestans TaxID=4787 RepID=A0A833T081_PHYIN|nr:hypothetical protein GN244_ATG13237 [Phytophthora infestans]KAF4128378.1 hypothetical protein GN958_ATG22456 [Phytophthora infestans]KAI9985592.1 hypothetical protein PInf_004973 [Phytophthora infestans]
MTIDVVVKSPPSPSPNATVLLLLHHDHHFRILERTLRDFKHLERRLELESQRSATIASVLPPIEEYCGSKPSFYPSNQLGTRLSIALEDFIRQLVTNSELLATSTALKTFLNGNLLTTHKAVGQSYRDAVNTGINAQETEMTEGRVTAGCSMEHQVRVEEKQLVLWRFASQGSGLMFSAEFSSAECGQSDIDPYSVGSLNTAENKENEREIAHYRTNCDFSEGDFVYGHFVAEKSGVVTLQWENTDMSSVVSKPLRLQVNVVPLGAANKVSEVVNGLDTVDTAEWLLDYVKASGITSVEDFYQWGRDETQVVLSDDSEVDDNSRSEGSGKDYQIEKAVLEERTHQLETHVMHLEESLSASKKELKSALDRVQIAEEIYKANLETITQLECSSAGNHRSKVSMITDKTADSAAAPPATIQAPGTQQEGPFSSELERVQRLCADFQEQCLWRSVENMELEAQLAASQVEAASWRDKHTEQVMQLEELEKQNRTLRTHKKMLVQEVKRLQPYSQVNLAALVQEAQEARMVQRSLQAKLDSHNAVAETAVETGPTDFVLVEASDEEP